MVMCPPNAEVPLSRVVNIIVKAFKFTGPVVYDTSRTNGQLKKTADHTTLDFEYTPLEDGIIRTVEWFENTNDKRM